MSALVANLAVAAGILLAGISAALAVVGLVSFLRLRHGRLLWVALAFADFAAKAVALAARSVRERAAIADGETFLPWLLAADLAIVLALYLAVLKR